MRDAWCDPRVGAVICARGGYGATRLLDLLDWNALRAATEESLASGAGPKILHGSSDITALHTAFGARLGVTTSFGPMPAGLIADPDAPRESLDALRAALFGGPVTLPGTRALRPGRAEGPLTGGTLSLLAALLGTPYAPPPAAGRIVFLEDVTEAPYRVDRMLVQLLQAGWLDGAAAWRSAPGPTAATRPSSTRSSPPGSARSASRSWRASPAGHGPRQHSLEIGAPAVLHAPDPADPAANDPHPAVPDPGALTLEAPSGGAR
ncbi:LD-carboxypeptidase [Actinomadura madurae]|nr:LD-carboxypeptidase [Actinomadura madurae]